jgi:Tfp pilus assembly protein PilF
VYFAGRAGYLCDIERWEHFAGMAFSMTISIGRTSQCAALLALLLGGCSFDLGSWSLGPDKQPQPKPLAQTTPEISAKNISDAQEVAVHGRTLARSGKTEEALAEFEKALALDPYNAQAVYGRGLIYQSEKQHEKAIEDFSSAHGLTPQRAEPLVARAVSYLALEKVKEAVTDLDEAVQADPNSATAWSYRGQAYERLGEKDKAKASYSRAIAIRPRNDAARNGLARIGG